MSPRPQARPASVLPDAPIVGDRAPVPPLRTKLPVPKPAAKAPEDGAAAELPAAIAAGGAAAPAVETVAENREPDTAVAPTHADALDAEAGAPVQAEPIAARVKPDVQRPLAPQPERQDAKRRMWIIPLGIGVVAAVVAVAAWKLRDTRQTVARVKPTEQTAPAAESGKLAERVGGAKSTASKSAPAQTAAAPQAVAPPVASPAPSTATATSAAPNNPELPVAHRAALLVEAPDEPNKVKTYLGTVVWKLDNVNAGPGDAVGLAVEADIDLPDDKMKATVTFEKNTDASLPASHTIKVRYTVQPGSPTGDIQQISVPQLRQEDSPSGEALAGVTVPVVQDSFLVGLSPGNAETVNIKQLKDMQWIDIPMLLSNGKIAKLTFEKGESGQRDLNEAIAAWEKS